MSKKCQNCGAHVSDRFGLVFGDSDDVVHHCTDCRTIRVVSSGAGAGKELNL